MIATHKPSRDRPPLDLVYEPARPDELAFVRCTWREGYRQAPGMAKMSWRHFKADRAEVIKRILDRSDVRVLVARDDGADHIAGWIAYTPDRRRDPSVAWSVPTVHWIYTRHEHRRRGIAGKLLEHADLGPRLIYTLRGAGTSVRYYDRDKVRCQGVTYDEIMVKSLRRRNVYAEYIEIGEWL